MQYYRMNHPASRDLRNPNGLAKLLRRNPCSSKDLLEIAAWRKSVSNITPFTPKLPFECPLELHAAYGFNEIKAALGIATFQSPGPMGTGVVHVPDSRAYIHFVTFIKQEKDFSPSTRYKDYPLSRSRLHWQTQATTSQESPTGKNHIFFKERGYTILICARVNKQESGCPCPFTYLGPMSNLVHYSGNRPISMIWDLGYPIPAEMFERVKMGG